MLQIWSLTVAQAREVQNCTFNVEADETGLGAEATKFPPDAGETVCPDVAERESPDMRLTNMVGTSRLLLFAGEDEFEREVAEPPKQFESGRAAGM